jgi:hypothetical protein
MNLYKIIFTSLIVLLCLDFCYSQEFSLLKQKNKVDNKQKIKQDKNVDVQYKSVRIIYLVPSDSIEKPKYKLGLQNTIKHIQMWYFQQLGKTFALHNPVVEVYKTTHEGKWYSTNPNGELFVQFWNNVLADGFVLTKGHFNDSNSILAFYIDTDPICGQCGGCGTSGVLVIGANDLRGIVGESWVPTCPNDKFTFKPCRFVGGLGHELGHAFGVPHPPGCDKSEPGCDDNSIMWRGFYNYPNCYFNQDEKQILLKNPFIFYDLNNPIQLFDCNKLLEE